MIDRETVFAIHQKNRQGDSIQKICRDLNISDKTVTKYLATPHPSRSKQKRKSKLDPYKEEIGRFVGNRSGISAVVVLRHIKELGFNGEISIVREFLKTVKKPKKHIQAYLRFETKPGRQVQIDWGHFTHIHYRNNNRKLYAFVAVESGSRMLYVEYTHSQNQASLHRCLLNTFLFFGGTPEELVVDNMLTAVSERKGPLVRFNDAFLDFLLPFCVKPIACNIRSPQEKGKVESAVKYLRNNFWPKATFETIHDLQSQVLVWLNEVANVRIHQTTREKPQDRFKSATLRALPDPLPEGRETLTLNVHTDFAVRFDRNMYSVPPWAVGKKVILKADATTVSIYKHERKIAVHNRSWEHGQRVELQAHKEQLRKVRRKLWKDKDVGVFLSLGPQAETYLNLLSGSGLPIGKTLGKLLQFKDEYGRESLMFALIKAIEFKAMGAEYIENILYQEMVPNNARRPVKLKKEELNRIRLQEPSLNAYDAIAVKRSSHDDT